jgi:hypothetical protein
MSKQSAQQLVPAASLLESTLAVIKAGVASASAKKQAPGSGVATEPMTRSFDRLGAIVAHYGAWVTPSAEGIITPLTATLLMEQAPIEAWRAASTCCVYLHGAAAAMVDAVMEHHVLSSDAAVEAFHRSAERLKCWTTMLHVVLPFVTPTRVRQYAAALAKRAAAFTGDELCEAASMDLSAALLLHMRPASAELLAAACETVSVAGGDSREVVRVAAAVLRAVAGSIQHPRCVPLYTPVVLDSAAHAPTALFASAPLRPQIAPAMGATFSTPAAPAVVAMKTVPKGKRSRSSTPAAAPAASPAAPPAITTTRAATPKQKPAKAATPKRTPKAKPAAPPAMPADDDDYDVGEIVDDDLDE